VFHDRVVEHTEVGAAAAGDAVVTFEGVAVLHPRGRFDIEMYATFLKLLGQARPCCLSRVSLGSYYPTLMWAPPKPIGAPCAACSGQRAARALVKAHACFHAAHPAGCMPV